MLLSAFAAPSHLREGESLHRRNGPNGGKFSQGVSFSPTTLYLLVAFTALLPVRPHTFCRAIRESGGQEGVLGGAKMKISLSANDQRTLGPAVTQYGPDMCFCPA